MMKFCAKTTKPFGVKTIVSLNSIMVDGTGMCGACRVSVGGQTKFVCVDGPDFDGHQVDWDLLMARQRQYVDEGEAGHRACYVEQVPAHARADESSKEMPIVTETRSEPPSTDGRDATQDPEVRGRNFQPGGPGLFAPSRPWPRPPAASSARSPPAARAARSMVRIPEFIKALRDDAHAGRGRDPEEHEQPARPSAAASARRRPSASRSASWPRRARRWPSAGWSATWPTGSASRASRRRQSPLSCGKKVAVVGSGPAGLTSAADLAASATR